MNFVTAFPKTRNDNGTIWVIVDHLKKSVVFVPIKGTCKKKQLVKTYIKHVVRLHGIPTHIISDREILSKGPVESWDNIENKHCFSPCNRCSYGQD